MSINSSALILQADNTSEYLEQRLLLGVNPENKRKIWMLLITVLLALGAYLRLEQFFFNRSLWLDEAFIASQIARGDWSSFFDLPMEYSHFVPPMFAVMGKTFVMLFGDNDLSLRIYPQLCALLALPLFYVLTRRLLVPWAVIISLFLFAISPMLIFHASNLKQYSSDVTFSLMLLLAYTYLPASDQPGFNKSLILFTLFGVCVVWFSHPSLFILASLGLYQGVIYLKEKNWHAAFKMLAVGCLWIASFALLYFGVNGGNAKDSSPIAEWLFIFWHNINNAFFPGMSIEGGLWIKDTALQFISQAGFKSPVFVIALMLSGVWVLLKKQAQLFIILILPTCITLLASYLELYVFSGRLILFLLPFYFIFIGVGVAQIASQIVFIQKKPYLCAGCSLLLFASLLLVSIKFPLNKEKVVQENKLALSYLQSHQHENDRLYVYYWADPAFHYYAASYGFDYSSCQHITPPSTKKSAFKEVDFYWSQKRNLLVKKAEGTQCILGFSESLHESAYELKLLQGHGRIWFYFTHLGHLDRQGFLDYLAKFGKLLDAQVFPGASVYLYDMGE